MDVHELRAAERFVAIEPLTATFLGYPVSVVNLSTTGAQIAHAAPIRLGSTGRLTLRRGEVSVDVQGLLAWSRLSKTPDTTGSHVYRSGIRMGTGNHQYALALHMLIKSGVLRRERDTLERKRQRLLERLAERNHTHRALPLDDIPADQILLVQHARERLLDDPEEALRWYHRGKYAITHGASNIEIESIRNREEVLAVWEYLERNLDITTIARIFEKLRQDSSFRNR